MLVSSSCLRVSSSSLSVVGFFFVFVSVVLRPVLSLSHLCPIYLRCSLSSFLFSSVFPCEVSLSLVLSLSLSFRLSVCLSVFLSVCLSVCLSLVFFLFLVFPIACAYACLCFVFMCVFLFCFFLLLFYLLFLHISKTRPNAFPFLVFSAFLLIGCHSLLSNYLL